MTACPRWPLSAVTVHRVLVVKNAWNRHSSNEVRWSATALGWSSGIRRTTKRPGTCALHLCEVNGLSATSAREIHRPNGSSKRFRVLDRRPRIIGILAITTWICLICRTLIDTAVSARLPLCARRTLCPTATTPDRTRPTSGAGTRWPGRLRPAGRRPGRPTRPFPEALSDHHRRGLRGAHRTDERVQARTFEDLYDWIAAASSPETANRYVLSIMDRDRLAVSPWSGGTRRHSSRAQNS